jgi:hypothetical protein
MIFKQASGDLLLTLCELISVLWEVKVDDKITGQLILQICRQSIQIS